MVFEKLYAEISREAIVKAKRVVDTVGHYARLNVARVIFDPAQRNPIEFQKREP